MTAGIDLAEAAGPLPNGHVAEWKAAGGRVVGFFCAHAPEELLWAAGALPVRLRGTGSTGTAGADQYLSSFNCSFVRHTLDRLLAGDLGFLDGIIITNSCDHVRRLFDICAAREVAPLCYYIDVPHIDSASARARLAAGLRALQERLQAAFGVEISGPGLSEAVRLYNRTRGLLSRASELCGASSPRLTGSEMLAMSVAAASVPRDRFNSFLERRLRELEAEPPPPSKRQQRRLMLIGGMLDDPAYLEVIESLGAAIVTDQLCCGTKSFSVQADETIDPLDAIAGRMLGHLPCPRMVAGYPERLAAIADAVRRYRVDGIICQRLKFCDLWGGEAEMLRHSLKQEIGVSLLVLEREYLTAGSIGQLRTRVQAFLESLE